MTEVEIKAHVKEPRLMRERIEALPGISGISEIFSSDTYYHDPARGLDESLFRLRLSEGKGIVTRKMRSRRGSLEVNEEIEYEVSDPDMFHDFAMSLGNDIYVRKEKRGIITTLDDITIGLWEVAPLGWFLEVEILSLSDDDQTVNAARDRILSLFDTLGITESDHEPRYYMEMLLSQKDI